jgi:hypothetical protein
VNRHAVLELVVLMTLLTASAIAQSVPKPAAQEPTGFTSYVEFGGTANSEGQIYEVITSVGYDFNPHFGADAGVPSYFVRPSSSTGATSANRARRLVQREISQTPVTGFPYGAFATGTACGALSMSGGGQTFSFNSAAENPPANPPSNISTRGGNAGSNGNLDFSGASTAVNGTTASAVAGIGNCNQGNGITTSGGATYGTPSLIPAQSLPVPPLPNPLPPTRGQNINSSTTLATGSYGNVNIQGGATVTLQGGTPGNPAVYTMNSLSLAGGSTLVINGCCVVINVAGVGQQNPVDFTGGSFQNNSFAPGNFVINYGGSANIQVSGARPGAGTSVLPDPPAVAWAAHPDGSARLSSRGRDRQPAGDAERGDALAGSVWKGQI